MTADDFEEYVGSLGHVVEVITGDDNHTYTVARELKIPFGGLAGCVCDVAIQRVTSEPYAVPAAIHTRPALVPMDTAGPLKTQASGIGGDWQYWSRRFDRIPTPKSIWTHILTVLTEVATAA